MNRHAQKLALALFLVAVSTGRSQISGPTEVTVAKGTKNVAIEVSVTADSAEYLALGNLEMIREYTRSSTKLVIRVLTTDVGNGYVVVAAVKNGEMLPLYRCLVRVVEPGPGPPIPPEPKPPEPRPPEPKPPEPVPVDPLVKSFRDAAYTDSLPLAKLRDLSDAFAAAGVVVVRRGTTVGQLQDSLTSEILKRVGALKEIAPALRKAIQDSVAPMDSVIPPDKREPELTESQREYAAALFAKIGKAALEASK